MSILKSTDGIRRLLHDRAFDRLRERLASMHPSSVAEQIRDLDPEETVEVLRHAPREICADVLSHLGEATQQQVVDLCHREELAELLGDMSPDDRVDLYKQMPQETQNLVVRSLTPSERKELLRLASYEEETAGALMTSAYVTLHAWQTAAEALESVRQQAEMAETIAFAYVVDDDGVLEGVVSIREILLADRGDRIGGIMRHEIIQVHVDDDQEEVAQTVSDADLVALPVVDDAGRLVGIITADDAMDVHVEEATEDFHRMAPVALMETGLREAGTWLLYRVRIPWLLALVFMNVFSGAAIARFEETIEAYVALVFFLPLLIDSGGNAGSQAATLVVRALGTGDVTPGDWLRMLGRELRVVLPLGLTMALGVALIAQFRAPEVLAPVGLAMIGCVAFGSLIGVFLPFVLNRLRMDPAAASAPLITSLADIGGVIIYFSIATWYLGIG